MNRSVQTTKQRQLPSTRLNPPPKTADPVIEGQWRERKTLTFKMNGFAWYLLFGWLSFVSIFAAAIASQAWEYSFVFSSAFVGGCMFTAFAAVMIVWVGTHK